MKREKGENMRGKWRLARRAAAFAAVVAAVGGTATLASGSTAQKAAAMTPVTVYFNPGSADGAGIEYCLKSGTCAKYGLKVSFKYSTQGGPQIIPAMVSGQVQFGEPGYEDTIVAASKGIPIIAVGPVSVAATSD